MHNSVGTLTTKIYRTEEERKSTEAISKPLCKPVVRKPSDTTTKMQFSGFPVSQKNIRARFAY